MAWAHATSVMRRQGDVACNAVLSKACKEKQAQLDANICYNTFFMSRAENAQSLSVSMLLWQLAVVSSRKVAANAMIAAETRRCQAAEKHANTAWLQAWIQWQDRR